MNSSLQIHQHYSTKCITWKKIVLLSPLPYHRLAALFWCLPLAASASCLHSAVTLLPASCSRESTNATPRFYRSSKGQLQFWILGSNKNCAVKIHSPIPATLTPVLQQCSISVLNTITPHLQGGDINTRAYQLPHFTSKNTQTKKNQNSFLQLHLQPYYRTIPCHIIQYIYPPISPNNALLHPLCRGEANGQRSGFSSEIQLWTSHQHHPTAEIRGQLDIIVSRRMHTTASLNPSSLWPIRFTYSACIQTYVPYCRDRAVVALHAFLYPVLQLHKMNSSSVGPADVHPCFPDPTPS